MPLTNFSYSSPLEQPTSLLPKNFIGPPNITDYDFTLNERVIEINGIKFQKRSDCVYNKDYYKFVDRVEFCKVQSKEWRQANPAETEMNLLRNLMQDDLFSLVYFVAKNPLANHPFIVNACKEIQDSSPIITNPDGSIYFTPGDFLDAWARDHLKTTIISVCLNVQRILNDPEVRIGIFSATRPLAVRIQNAIKKILEDLWVVKCFPDILYKDPSKEAERWSESPEGGLIVKRKGYYIDPTVSCWGLVEGLPTGPHFNFLTFDDIVTKDTLSPDIMEKVKENIDMCENVATRDRIINVVGTFYRHDDPLTYILEKTNPTTSDSIFKFRKKPATVGGEYNGKAVFQTEESLQRKRSGKQYIFYCQQLLNPTPRGEEKLDNRKIVLVSRRELPTTLYKFMVIDAAGDEGRRRDGRNPDAWAFHVVGVEPISDQQDGSNRIFILDSVIDEMDLLRAQKEIVDMYLRNGRILRLGIEKVGMSTTEIHIANALRAKGKFLSVEKGNLHLLSPQKRTKEYRIESALVWALNNGKIHMLDTVPGKYRNRLALEMEKFPHWHDDGLDALSYVYDITKEYRFAGSAESVEAKPESQWDAAFRRAKEARQQRGWIAV